MVQEPVQDGAGQDLVPEDIAPVQEALVRRQDQARLLVAPAQQPEKQAGRRDGDETSGICRDNLGPGGSQKTNSDAFWRPRTGRSGQVPLSPEACRLLTSLPRRLEGKVWGVQSHAVSVTWGRALARARKAYEKECEEMGIKPDPS